MRTCWKQLSPFHDTGRLLKFRYDTAVRVLSVTNAATGETELAGPRRHGQSHRSTDLVFLEDSPSFCRPSRYSPGTAGRSCAKDTSCQSLCCGRGYNTAMHLTTLSCHCQVRWCCHVECQTCVREEEVYTCKNTSSSFILGADICDFSQSHLPVESLISLLLVCLYPRAEEGIQDGQTGVF